jgi:hypothetical protein
MLEMQQTTKGWQLVDSPNDDAGMPVKLVKDYRGPLAKQRCFFGLWARMLPALLAAGLRAVGR